MSWTIEILPFALGCGWGLFASRRALSVSFAGKAFGSLVVGALFSALAGELTGPSGPLAVLVDSCGIAAGWVAVEALLGASASKRGDRS